MEIKTCSNCGHKYKKHCNLRGLYISVERQHITDGGCGINFDGWVPIPKDIKVIKCIFKDNIKEDNIKEDNIIKYLLYLGLVLSTVKFIVCVLLTIY